MASACATACATWSAASSTSRVKRGGRREIYFLRMASSRRVSRSRRAFLKSLPTAIAAGAAAPSIAENTHAQSEPEVTADALGVAQQIIGVDLPAAERESARSIVTRNRDNYDLIRKVVVAP